MSAEPQPRSADKLDKGLFALKTVWFGLFSGAVVITVTMTAIVFSGDGPMMDLGELAYLFLLAGPLGLVGAFVLTPMMTPRDPAPIVHRAGKESGRPMYEGWDGTNPNDPYYWFPVYVTQFFIRAGMLEGTAIICAVGFMITANWALLGGALVMIAVLAIQVPTRTAVESFAETTHQRHGP